MIGPCLVEVEFRDGTIHTTRAVRLDWGHRNTSDDIIAYRIVEGGAS